jgi:NH3-dependent NAD+ synthetase
MIPTKLIDVIVDNSTNLKDAVKAALTYITFNGDYDDNEKYRLLMLASGNLDIICTEDISMQEVANALQHEIYNANEISIYNIRIALIDNIKRRVRIVYDYHYTNEDKDKHSHIDSYCDIYVDSYPKLLKNS